MDLHAPFLFLPEYPICSMNYCCHGPLFFNSSKFESVDDSPVVGDFSTHIDERASIVEIMER